MTYSEWLAGADWLPPGFEKWEWAETHWRYRDTVSEAVRCYLMFEPVESVKRWVDRFRLIGGELTFTRMMGKWEVSAKFPDGSILSSSEPDHGLLVQIEDIAGASSVDWSLADAKITEEIWMGISRL